MRPPALLAVAIFACACVAYRTPLGESQRRSLGVKHTPVSGSISLLQTEGESGLLLPAGTKVKFERAVGKGSFSTVYLGQLNGEDVAIKLPLGDSEGMGETVADMIQYFTADALNEAEKFHRVYQHADAASGLENIVAFKGLGFISYSGFSSEFLDKFGQRDNPDFFNLFLGEHETLDVSAFSISDFLNGSGNDGDKTANVFANIMFMHKVIPFLVLERCESSIESFKGLYSIGDESLDNGFPTPSGLATANFAYMKSVLGAIRYLGTYADNKKWAWHRDIKPENILVCNKKPKLGDLGTVVFFDKEVGKAGAEDINDLVGTMMLVPPELIVVDPMSFTQAEKLALSNKLHLGYNGHVSPPETVSLTVRTAGIVDYEKSREMFSARDMWAAGVTFYLTIGGLMTFPDPVEMKLSELSFFPFKGDVDITEGLVDLCRDADYYAEGNPIVWGRFIDNFGEDSPLVLLLRDMMRCDITKRIGVDEALKRLEMASLNGCTGASADNKFCREFMHRSYADSPSIKNVLQHRTAEAEVSTPAVSGKPLIPRGPGGIPQTLSQQVMDGWCSGCSCTRVQTSPATKTKEYEYSEGCSEAQLQCCQCDVSKLDETVSTVFARNIASASARCLMIWSAQKSNVAATLGKNVGGTKEEVDKSGSENEDNIHGTTLKRYGVSSEDEDSDDEDRTFYDKRIKDEPVGSEDDDSDDEDRTFYDKRIKDDPVGSEDDDSDDENRTFYDKRITEKDTDPVGSEDDDSDDENRTFYDKRIKEKDTDPVGSDVSAIGGDVLAVATNDAAKEDANTVSGALPSESMKEDGDLVPDYGSNKGTLVPKDHDQGGGAAADDSTLALNKEKDDKKETVSSDATGGNGSEEAEESPAVRKGILRRKRRSADDMVGMEQEAQRVKFAPDTDVSEEDADYSAVELENMHRADMGKK